MGCEYLKTVHGILSVLQTVLGLAALLAGFFVWNNGDVFFLFWMGEMRLLTLVLVILMTVWIISMAILLNQVFGTDVLEKLGKLKVLALHGLCALVVLVGAVIESYYYGQIISSSYYIPRLLFVMVSCWLLLITYVCQFGFVVLQ
uniref:Uncharacterized protein n=1 Tax=Ditylenchus dipsaci TaxID=166011 RepID=A0A915CQ21_9BILA